MDLKGYNDFVKDMKIYPDAHKITYPALGLSGEAGECAEKIKKWLRGDKELDKKELAKEIGDVLFYVVALGDDIGYTLQEILDMNVDKLTARKKNGVIKGDGDNRGEEKKLTVPRGYESWFQDPFSFGKPEPKMPKDRGTLIYRELVTPDGTVLVCRHRHDYKEHWDNVTFQTYILDGFQGYYRASVNGDEVINELYSFDPIEKIREKFEWGQNYDSDMNKLPNPIWIKLKDIEDSHLDAIIVYCEDTGNINLPIFRREKEYRYRLKHGGKI